MLFGSRFTQAVRSYLAVLAAISLITPLTLAQAPPASLQITILDGDEAMNNIRQRTAREPIVQVEDENHKPVAGAVVIFLLPNDGPGGAFANGARTLTVTTDSKGQAIARGLQPNHLSGRFQIRVQASYQGRTAQANINQTNQVGTSASKASSSSSSLKWIAIIAAGAVTAAAVAIASHGNSSTPASSVPVAVIPGTGAVGPPR